MRTRWLILTAVLALGACKRHNAAPANTAAHAPDEQAGPELPALTVADLAGRLERHEAIGVFDVNNRGRYEQGHIPGAVWVAMRDVRAELLPANHGTPLVFYCANEH